MKKVTKSFSETRKLGSKIALTLAGRKPRGNQALIIALEGNLGSGKTTFIQGFAEGLGVKENVLSPTFLILKQFPIYSRGRIRVSRARSASERYSYANLYHIDAYRLKNPEEIVELGFEDIVRDPENIIVIEWADKIRKILPKDIPWIKFENMGGNKRKIIIFNF